MTTLTATYSPEDNKLRLYASARLDDETFARVKAAGFKWAPKQELFVAPAWSPAREDLLIELAGDIEPEGTTLAERAAAKAERLDALAETRRREASRYTAAADSIAERFYGGQPILIGHHSERRARRDQARMHDAMRKACDAREAVNYWLSRASGVERHANYKVAPRVRANRIKTLLAELRDLQRRLHHAEKKLTFWRAVEKAAPDAERLRALVGRIDSRLCGPYEEGLSLERGELPAAEYVARRIAASEATLASDSLARWIAHTLSRLAYERAELGPIARYEGPLSPATLQIFAREQGADKPKAEATADGFVLRSPVALPAHLGDGREIELSADDWRDLMQQCGHVPADKAAKPALPPILNFRAADGVTGASKWRRGEIENLAQAECTQAEYARIHNDYKGTRLSACGSYRFRVAMAGSLPGGRGHGLVAVFLSDQKEHAAPVAEAQQEAA